MWRVSCVNRQTRELFERDLFLDITTAPTEDRRRIKHILDSDNHRAMLKYRHLFREQALPEGERDQKAMARGRFSAVSLSSYYEDEAGNPLDELRFMQALAGHEDIIIPGNPASVMRLGPTDIARPEKWTLRKANDVAHFLEVTNCLALSDWSVQKRHFRTPVTQWARGKF
jgi:hypothetical protein